jgi:AcrR family transcriptional regulator
MNFDAMITFMSGRGRPRTFDTDRAIENAMRVFWRNGYEATTLDDLTDAMKVSRPSLYAAFGSKDALFLKVVERYREYAASYLNDALEKTTAREVFETLIDGAVNLQTDPLNPSGCLYVQGALVSSEANAPIRSELARRRKDAENAIRKRFTKAVDEGDLPAATDSADLARFTAVMLHGLAVQAAGGDSREKLKRAAKFAFDVFP